MISSVTNMWISTLMATTLIAMANAQGKEYLPPNKGYNYPPPEVPFPAGNNGAKQPAPRPQPPNPQPPPPPPPRQPTTNAYIPPPSGPTGGGDHDDHHHEPGMPFDFAYAVNENGNDYSHSANSDGDVTRGMYRVALPDGRTQLVTYTADWKNGFNAQVTYEGEARYPDQPSGGYGRGPATAPAAQGPAYVPPSQSGGYQY